METKLDKRTVQWVISSLIDGINQYSIELNIIRKCADKNDKDAQEIIDIKRDTIDRWTKKMKETIINNGFNVDDVIRVAYNEGYIYDSKKKKGMCYTYRQIKPRS